jgi:predicted MFS family arabinose efflux permease
MSGASTSAGTGMRDLVQVLSAPTLRRLFLARTISVLGDMMVPVALAFAILWLTGSASALGIVLAARALPAVVFMLYGGAVGDRYPRRLVMVSAQLVASAAQVTIGILVLAGVADVVALAALVAVRGATSAFFNPASTAAITVTSDPARRQQTFSAFAMVGSVAEVGGPALAGALLVVLSPGWVILLDGMSFLVSAALIWRCDGLGEGSGRGAESTSIVAAMRDGCQFVRRTPWLSVLIVSAAVFQFSLLSSITVLGPLVAERSLGGPAVWATIVAALGLGGVLGSWLGLRIRPRTPLRFGYSLMVVGAGPTLVLLAVPAPVPLIVLSEFVAGVAIAIFGTLESTTISHHVPAAFLSRVDAINRFGSMGLRPLGVAVVAPTSTVVGLRATLVGAAMLSLAAILVPLAHRGVRTLAAEPAPA